MFNIPKIGFSLSAMLLTTLMSPFVADDVMAAQADDLHQYCRQVRNDDAIREYSHALYRETVEAFRKYAPRSKGTFDDSDFKAQAQYRCMNGKIMVCFVGANLPCVKMNANRRNAGADAACRQNPGADGSVSASEAGHDAVYSYRCHNGKAEIIGQSWKLDERGFAKDLWTEVPDR